MSGDLLDFYQGNKETITGTLHDPAATTGHVLTVQADKSVKAQAGGGTTPVQAFYSGNAVTVADGASGNLTWNALDGGVELLDRSVPGAPTFLADGFYAILATALVTTPITAAGFATVGVNGPDVNAAGVITSGTTGAPVTVPQLCHYSAGDSPIVVVANADGVASRDFLLSSAMIVKLA